MAFNLGYRSFADFEREEIRPGMRAGWSMDEDLRMPSLGEVDFDVDPWEAAVDAAEAEGYEDD